MKYIKLENNQPKDYSIEQLFIDYPDAVIYKSSQMPNEQLLANYSVYPLITEAQPEIKEDETVEESTPEFRDGEWHQTWRIRKLTEEEINEIVENRLAVFDSEDISSLDENPKGFFSSEELQEQRYEICKSCDSFTVLKTCRECSCIMPLKIKIADAGCPLEKW
jgi:hypothetical protein